MSLIRKGKSYFGVFKENGKQTWISLKTMNKDEAQIRHAQLLKERGAERFGLPKSPRDLPWPDVLAAFARHKQANGLAESTLVRIKIVLKTAERVLGIRHCSDWSAQQLERFKELRGGEGIKPSTINRDLVVLKDALRFARKSGYAVPPIEAVDAVKLVKNPPRAPVFFTPEEIAMLLEGVEPFWRVAILLGAYAGLRRSEALNLRWSDVNLDRGEMLIVDRLEFRTKTRMSRGLPMHEAVMEALRAWKPVCDYQPKVLPWDRLPIDFSRSFGRLLRRKGIAKGTYHTLRHSFASNLVRSDVGLARVRELLGHRSLGSTIIYTHLQPSDLTDALKKLPPG